MESIIFNEFMEMDNLQLQLVNGGATAEQWIVGTCTVAGAIIGGALGTAIGGPVGTAIGGKLGSAVSTGIGVVVSAGVSYVANKTSAAIIGK